MNGLDNAGLSPAETAGIPIDFSRLVHELRGPLTSLTMLSSRAVRRFDLLTRDELKRTLCSIDKASLHLETLVEDLVDFALHRAEQLTLRAVDFDVTAVAAEVAERMNLAADRPRIRVVTGSDSAPDSAPEAEPVRARADPTRTQQVFANLLGNAARCSPLDADIEVSVRRVEGRVEVRVSDQGTGLTSDELDLVFLPFYQVSLLEQRERARRSRARLSVKASANHSIILSANQSPTPVDDTAPVEPRRGGMGLGLYICRTLVERMGGHIHAESQGPGLGSVFAFDLPAAATPPTTKNGEAAR